MQIHTDTKPSKTQASIAICHLFTKPVSARTCVLMKALTPQTQVVSRTCKTVVGSPPPRQSTQQAGS